MASDDLGNIRHLYAVLQRRDNDEVAKAVAHDVEWDLPATVPWGGLRHGPLGIMSLLEVFDEHVDGRWADPEEFLDAGDSTVIVLGVLSGRARTTGREFQVQFSHLWRLSDGVPTMLRAYYDTATVLAALDDRN